MPGDLDGVLDRLGPRVEESRPLVMRAGCDPVQFLAYLYIALVGHHHEAGMSEVGDLFGDPADDKLGTVADGGDRDARAEVDQRVAVGVDEYPAARRGHEDGQHMAQAPGDAALAALEQLAGDGARDLSYQMALLDQGRAAEGGVQVHRPRIARLPARMRAGAVIWPDLAAAAAAWPCWLLLSFSPALIDFRPEEFA